MNTNKKPMQCICSDVETTVKSKAVTAGRYYISIKGMCKRIKSSPKVRVGSRYYVSAVYISNSFNKELFHILRPIQHGKRASFEFLALLVEDGNVEIRVHSNFMGEADFSKTTIDKV